MVKLCLNQGDCLIRVDYCYNSDRQHNAYSNEVLR